MTSARTFVIGALLFGVVFVNSASASGALTPAQVSTLYLQAAKGNVQALRQLQSAAQAGDADAQVDLGLMYDQGQGVPQNYAEALKWYRKAADQGDATAQYNVGVMYDHGQGVPQNHAEAAKWFRKAAAQGISDAQYNLGVMYHQGQGVPQNYVAAAKWLRKAADQGDVQAQRNLAVMYWLGRGVPQDYTQALKWFIVAKAAGGSKKAAKGMQILERFATPAQIAQSQALARAWWAAHHGSN